MTMPNHDSRLRRVILALGFVLSGAATIAACSVHRVVLADDPDSSAPPAPIFEPMADASDGSSSPPSAALMCEGTECPPPYATCGTTPSLRCGTNLLSDPMNCGECGNVCPGPDFWDGVSFPTCIKGVCGLKCGSIKGICAVQVYEDCNGDISDGCEVEVSASPVHCGSCGKACPDGTECVAGVCGCPAGKTLCLTCEGDSCRDTASDDANCGACNNPCPPTIDDGCAHPPPNTHYGCANSNCGALKCDVNAADCDGDLQQGCNSNGCEVVLTIPDPLNCGACNNVCKPGEVCRIEKGLGPQCLAPCEATGGTMCGDECRDLLFDPLSCGHCGLKCPSFGRDRPVCHKGICKTECEVGFADCDGNPLNGCEVDVTNNPLHCGGCGVSCNYAAGQPCVEGKCLMVGCDAGGAIPK